MSDIREEIRSVDDRERLIFHVGLPKTGSSALQVFLSNNVNSLLDHGISYPNSELPPTTAANQHRQQSNGGNLIRSMRKAAARTRVTFYDETELAEPFLKATLMEVIENRKSRSLLLSGEFLSAPKPTEILTRLFPKLQNKFHITVIAGYRRYRRPTLTKTEV